MLISCLVCSFFPHRSLPTSRASHFGVVNWAIARDEISSGCMVALGSFSGERLPREMVSEHVSVVCSSRCYKD